MIDFSHILIPYDGSASASVSLNTAIDIAKKFDSKLTAVYVKKTDVDPKADEIARDLASMAERHQLDIVSLQPVGKMYKEVVKAVEAVEAGIVIMGTHGVTGFEEFWIGSNAFRVVSSCPVPVITMQGDFDKGGFGKILAPIDQSKETRQKIPYLQQIAEVFGAEVHLMGATKYNDDESKATVMRYLEQSQELLKKDGFKVSSSTMMGGNIAKATLDAAAQEGAELIIMMSESEPSSGLFMGSNAQQVINRSKIPVLTLHPVDVGVVTASGY